MVMDFKTFFKMLDYQDKRKFYLLVILLLISGLLSLLGIGAILPFINALMSPGRDWLGLLFPKQNQAHILLLSLFVMIVAFWVKNILSYYCLKVQTEILYETAYKFSRRLFHGYMQAPYLWHLNQSTPELVRNAINECAILANGILGPFGNFLTELVTSLFIFIVLLFLNIKFTLIVTGFLLFFMVLFIQFTRNQTDKYAKDRGMAWAAMTKDVMQGLGGIKETKIYALEQHFILSFNAQTYIAARSAAFSNVYSQASRFILESVAITTVMLAIGFLLWTGQSNEKIVLLLSVFGVAAIQLLPSLNRMMVAFASIKYSLPALKVIEQGLADQSARVSSERRAGRVTNFKEIFKKEVLIDQISFAYPSGKLALSSVTLEIKKGQRVALVGYSGSGKTTLVDIVLGLLPVQSGRILIDGIELTLDNLSLWQSELGYIPQNIYLYNCSIRENVAFGASAEETDDDSVWRALEMASLQDFIQQLAYGLDTEIGENGVRLSGGQRQRIGIARALYRNPKVLIMDEATAALDNQTEREVTSAIQKASENRTVITIAHRLSTIRNSDVIFVMHQGRIAAQGLYDELIANNDLFAKLVRLEAHHEL